MGMPTGRPAWAEVRHVHVTEFRSMMDELAADLEEA